MLLIVLPSRGKDKNFMAIITNLTKIRFGFINKDKNSLLAKNPCLCFKVLRIDNVQILFYGSVKDIKVKVLESSF